MKNLLNKVLLTIALLFTAGVVQAQVLYRVDSINDLLQINIYGADAKALAFVGGGTARDDGLGGLFFYDGNATATTNVYNIYKPVNDTGRWFKLPTAVAWQNATAATAATDTTYGWKFLRSSATGATNNFTIGADNSNVYLQSWDSKALHINNISNDTILNALANNVGIGDITPDTKLEVLSSTAPQLRLTHTDGVDDMDFSVDANGDSIIAISGDNFVIQNDVDAVTGVQVLDADGGTPILNIDTTNERVGIGNAAPTVALDVTGAAAISSTLGVTGAATLASTLSVAGASSLASAVITNAATAGTLAVGGGTAIVAIYTANGQIDFPAIDPFGTTNMTLTVTGAGTNSAVSVSVTDGTGTTHVGLSGYVNVTNTVTIVASNPTAASLDPGANVSYRAVVFQY